MKKVKLFRDISDNQFENEVNDWLEEAERKSFKILDVIYSSTTKDHNCLIYYEDTPPVPVKVSEQELQDMLERG